ncbi:MAG: histidine kinase [Bacteroides sp.]|nr:histidine kinase [Ruminococcus flavefaciens]MCM1555534.1 histidine kinase [Bacteroides sp.]
MNHDSFISRRLPVVALVCALFITYPNIAWIPWNLAQLSAGEEAEFWAFFVFRIAYFYALFYFQLRYNLRKIGAVSLLGRIGRNFLYTLVGCAAFVGLSYGLPLLGIQTGYVGNILLFQFFVLCLLCSFIGYISALYESRREKEQEIERLKIENLQSRCDALANQINPHFFFNSLNGINSLIRKGNNEDTVLYVNKLSDIFRYILQSEKRGLVPLGEELAFTEAFMHVLEVRFANKLSYSVDVPESAYGRELPVLSLLPLIENVTVHNTIDSDHRMHLSIRLNAKGELEVSNPVYPKLVEPETHGIGLANLSHRFELMMKKDIRIKADGIVFCVSLPLK